MENTTKPLSPLDRAVDRLEMLRAFFRTVGLSGLDITLNGCAALGIEKNLADVSSVVQDIIDQKD